MEPLISVILPIYNMEAYLGRCLDSILASSYINLEIICVDDGSSDSTAEILRAYAEKDSRIIVITKENGGVSSARNAGLDRMTGEYVTFVDPDDYVHPQYFEFLYLALLKKGTLISICGFRMVNIDDKVDLSEKLSFDPNEVQVYSYLHISKQHNLRSYCCGKMFWCGLVTGVRFCEGMLYAEDTVFCTEVGENEEANQVAVLDRSLYYYFQREGSAAKTATLSQMQEYAKVCIEKLNNSSYSKDYFLDRALKVCLYTRYFSSHFSIDKEIKRESNKLLKGMFNRLLRTNIYSFKEKVCLSIFIICPAAYWLYRIIRDPYMWKWEKWEKKKRREARKAA